MDPHQPYLDRLRVCNVFGRDLDFFAFHMNGVFEGRGVRDSTRVSGQPAACVL
jgi:hypothetical protein